MLHRLSKTDLRAGGPFARLGHRVLVFDEIDSTNAYLLDRAEQLGDGAIVAAEHQSAGRGRLGRRWVAPRGSSVMLSVLLIEPTDSPLLTCATMLASLAACEAIEACTDQQPALRWPNDLVLNGRKLAGVLAESTALADGRRALVIGIGINCLQQRGHFDNGLAQAATSLEMESTRSIQRAAIAAQLVSRMDKRIRMFDRDFDGVRNLRAAWKSRCADIGTHVKLRQDGDVARGTVIDISDDADLILELDHGGRKHFGAATTTRIG